MMNILCLLCCEEFQPSDDIISNPCGHIFHYPCITKCLEKSQTCPQCKGKVMSQIRRVRFIFSNDGDRPVLQEQVDSLKVQLSVKDAQVKRIKSKKEKLRRVLKAKIRKLKSALAKRKSMEYALRKFLERSKKLSSVVGEANDEIKYFHKKLADLRRESNPKVAGCKKCQSSTKKQRDFLDISTDSDFSAEEYAETNRSYSESRVSYDGERHTN